MCNFFLDLVERCFHAIHGVESLEKDFIPFLYNSCWGEAFRKERKMSFYVLIIGYFETENLIDFGNGIRIKPINKKIEVFDLAALGARGFQEWAILEPIIHACKYEIISDFYGDTKNGYDLLNRVWLFSQIAMHRNINMQCIAYSTESWESYSGLHRLKNIENRVSIGILDYHREVIAFKKDGKTNFSEEDVNWIKDNFNVYNSLANKNTKFRIALESASNWRYSHSGRLAVASIWAGIESLFSVNSELVFRISLYIANALETQPYNRLQKFRHIKNLYSKRSKAVHGEDLSDKDLLQIIHDSFDVLKDLIVNIVENNEMFTEERINKLMFGEN